MNFKKRLKELKLQRLFDEYLLTLSNDTEYNVYGMERCIASDALENFMLWLKTSKTALDNVT